MISLAAEQVADLWVEQIQKPLNKDNGDSNPMLFMLATMVSQSAQSAIDPQKLTWFKGSIIRQIEKHFNEECHYTKTSFDISADYGPDQTLAMACHDAGISSECLPWKSHTIIRLDANRIDYKFGYTASHQQKTIC